MADPVNSWLCNPQIGSAQLKCLQDLLHSCDGVYGARFSGAGTRGACVALVHADATEQVATKAGCFRGPVRRDSRRCMQVSHFICIRTAFLCSLDKLAVPLLTQVMQAYAREFPGLADAAQVIVSSSSDGARLLKLQ